MAAAWLNAFSTAGFALWPELMTALQCDELAESVASAASGAGGRAGRRNLLQTCPAVRDLAQSPTVRAIVSAALGGSARCVKVLWFDKTPRANWSVPWHQDLMIAVQQRHDAPGYTAWSLKQGVPHVKPPVAVLERMAALRIHLDDCGPQNGPLRVLPGSHGRGELDDADTAALAARVAPVECVLPRGGALLMRPLLVHSSARAALPQRRRVLHLEFSAETLPAPLVWYDFV